MKTDFIQDLNLINSIDPLKTSLSLDRSGKLVQTQKRSSAANFWHWVIHLVTFTLVPLNKDLDAVAKRILSQSSDLNPQQPLDKDEKKTLKGALSKLEILLKSNGSRESKKITQLLRTVKDIKTLQMKKNGVTSSEDLDSKPSDSHTPQVFVPPEIRLQNFLENIFTSGNWSKRDDVPQTLTLLLEIKDPENLMNILTKEQSDALRFNLDFTEEKWLEEHAKELSQGTVNFLKDLYLSRKDQTFYTNLIKYRSI
ncbi:MAG: hypothetical protein BGO14_11510 [Chlamydiales bacterium 38-26]|nr:hypothetical protein [Chlamydiales bacterium]OJV11568.1 MAG: hypothetical protein BGO14_11510 [Chlamydiales bacterium 38-26]